MSALTAKVDIGRLRCHVLLVADCLPALRGKARLIRRDPLPTDLEGEMLIFECEKMR
jgi:hypothetical protein